MVLPAKHDFPKRHLPKHDIDDDIGRSRFDWPEPLILDIIVGAYDLAIENEETMEAVRLHARCLRALIDGETERSASLRVELIARCALQRITPEAIGVADHAVFSELNLLIQSRFRNSPRLRLHFVERLHDALGRLTSRPAPSKTGERPRRLRFPYPARQPRYALAFAS